MFATIWSSSMIKIFFMLVLGGIRLTCRAMFQEQLNPLELPARLFENLSGIGELAVAALALQLAQERHQMAHAAGGAGPGATVSHAPDFGRVARHDRSAQFVELFCGLGQVKRH